MRVFVVKMSRCSVELPVTLLSVGRVQPHCFYGVGDIRMGARGWALHVVAYVSSLPVLIDGGSAYVRGWYGAGDMRKLLGPPEGPHHRVVAARHRHSCCASSG